MTYEYPETLLPPNATALDRHLEMVIRHRFDELPVVVLRQFWHADQCPVHLLPSLARQLSVDVWQEDWSDSRQRSVIAASPALHRIKGTRGAIELALSSLGQSYEFVEWWETGADRIDGYTPANCTASLQLDGNTQRSSGVAMPDILQALRRAKRLTLHISITVVERLRSHRIYTPALVVSHANAPELMPEERIRATAVGQVAAVYWHIY